MMHRRTVGALAVMAVFAMGIIVAQCPNGDVATLRVTIPGYAEPHTPGSGAPEEMAASANVQAILGPSPDLNRVTYVRTHIEKPSGAPPRAILIVVPGFLGAATNFVELARQLVQSFNGTLEVWAVDRRPNQLEDVRGIEHAVAGVQPPATPAQIFQAIAEAAQFYEAETAEFDLDDDGVVDPQFELPDAIGGTQPYVQLAQDDLRFAAYWGLDTYVRDWKALVDLARSVVGSDGLVLFGGHSMGTGFAATLAAYDFDPGASVVAGHDLIDGLLLLEGGGLGVGTGGTTQADYLTQVANLASLGGPDVTLTNFNGIEPARLGPAAAVGGVAGLFDPDAPAIGQRSSVFGSGSVLSLLIPRPATNRSLVGLFADDDFQPLTPFRASVGFSSNGDNVLVDLTFLIPPPLGAPSYIVQEPYPPDTERSWQEFDDPLLPTCPPNDPLGPDGCAILDNGARPAPTDPPVVWGLEAEVTSLDDMLHAQYENGNFIEWYYVSGRIDLDLSFGRDSSALGDESLLAITQNAAMDKPVLCIGGSNGLAPLESSFSSYLGSIATPPADQQIVIVEGYAHLDMLMARDNAAVPPIRDWINGLLQRKLLGAL